MNGLTKVEKWICGWTAAIVAVHATFYFSFPPAFFGVYFVLYLFFLLSIDVSLELLLLVLKNQGNWWGW